MLEHPSISYVNRYGLPELSDAKQDMMERIDWLRTEVSCWADNELDEGREPTWEGFVTAHPQHDREDYIEDIEREIKAAIQRADHYEPLRLKHEHELALSRVG